MLALREEDVDARLRLLRAEQLDEPLALARQPLSERQFDGVGDARDRVLLGEPAARFRLRALARRGQHGAVGLRGRRADLSARLAAERPGQRDRARARIGLDGVDQPDLACPLRAGRLAAEDHLQRGPHADQPRQPLRPARAGQQPARDLRQPEPRRRRRDAVVARERDLQAAAHGDAVDRRDDRLRRGLQRVDQVARVRPRRRADPEALHVGPAAEGAVRTGQHECRDGIIGLRGFERGQHRGNGLRAERVHRRVVDQQDRPAVVVRMGHFGRFLRRPPFAPPGRAPCDRERPLIGSKGGTAPYRAETVRYPFSV